MTDTIGGFSVIATDCAGCGKPLLLENAWMTDGCPCNSNLGVNSHNETRWRLLMELQQKQSHEHHNLVMLVRRLSRQLKRVSPEHTLHKAAEDYLKRIGVAEGILRSQSTSPTDEPTLSEELKKATDYITKTPNSLEGCYAVDMSIMALLEKIIPRLEALEEKIGGSDG